MPEHPCQRFTMCTDNPFTRLCRWPRPASTILREYHPEHIKQLLASNFVSFAALKKLERKDESRGEIVSLPCWQAEALYEMYIRSQESFGITGCLLSIPAYWRAHAELRHL